MDAFSRSLGDTVRFYRNKLGLTQLQLVDRIHIEKRTILNIENYKANPKMEILYPLIRELQINPISIFYPENDASIDISTQFQMFLSQCSSHEISFLYAVCQGVLDALRSEDKVSTVE
ncbi:MAG: helix-turn-helix domain-containing protein [Clostridia bacterium]|nr:helix-turn-helix domain-containing protein [Clostridia bacterium]